MELELREHQMRVIEELREGFRQGCKSQLLYAPTGFGKTEVALYLMKAAKEKFKRSAMVMDRIVLVDQTSLRLSKYGIPHGVMQAGHWKWDPRHLIQVCSAQTLERRDSMPDLDLLVVDECFPAETMVSTPSGDVPISLVRCGDTVHNATGVGKVVQTIARPAQRLLRLEFDDGSFTECTENHPFFTSRGWRSASTLEVGESFVTKQGMCLLWQTIFTEDDGRARESSSSHVRESMERANMLLQILLKESAQSDEQPSITHEDAGAFERNKTSTNQEGWQRSVASSAAACLAARAGGGLGSGTCGIHQDEAFENWLSDLLQAGLGVPGEKNWDRAGRREPLFLSQEGTRLEENRVFCFPRLVNISVVEREGLATVFNLHVSGHPSYFADGRLVHNCHIARKQTTEFIKNNPHVSVVGLTATPFTKGLGQVYDRVVCGATNSWLVDNRWLTPLKVYIAKQVDMTGAKKVAGEWSQDVATERSMVITGDIVEEWIKKTHEIYGKPEKTIVFCAGVAHGADLVEQFARKGYNFVSISYRDNDDFKREAIEDFAKPDTQIHGLIATDILTRGFDVADVKIGVSARPFSKSLSSHVQQMGRIMRPHPSKTFSVWLDHAGNYLRFRDDWDDLYASGVSELDERVEKAKPEPTEREKQESKCPKCGYLWSPHDDECPSCGHVRQRRNHVAAIAGHLEELFSEARPQMDKQRVYSELVGYAIARGYNPNWAKHKYREKFGVWPRGLHDMPLQPSMDTANWIKSRAIAWAKSQKRVTMV